MTLNCPKCKNELQNIKSDGIPLETIFKCPNCKDEWQIKRIHEHKVKPDDTPNMWKPRHPYLDR